MEEEVIMKKRNKWTICMMVGAMALALGLSGCGRRGNLERPPAKDQSQETTDNKSLTRNQGL